MMRLVSNSGFLKDEKALSDILGDNLRRFSIGPNREKRIVLEKEHKLVSIPRQYTVIHVLPLIGITF